VGPGTFLYAKHARNQEDHLSRFPLWRSSKNRSPNFVERGPRGNLEPRTLNWPW
jgi:hypothetical protein